MGAWVRRQANLSLLQHALHRTAAAPLPREHLTGGGGVFEDAENKFVIITVTEINVRLGQLTHCGQVTQICVFNMVKLVTSASSP